MVIQVQMIPSDYPLTLSFVIPKELINVSAKGYPKAPFASPVKCDAKLRKMEDYIEVHADVRADLDPVCDRCLCEFDNPFEKQVYFSCTQQGTQSNVDEDFDYYFFFGRELDLTPIIREIILLDQPMINLCDESCKGLCGSCGANLNLGDHGHFCEKITNFPQKIQNL